MAFLPKLTAFLPKLTALPVVLAILQSHVHARFVVETDSISALYPMSLRSKHDGATGNFGLPDYGGSLVGAVVYPEKGSHGCEALRVISLSSLGILAPPLLFLIVEDTFRGRVCECPIVSGVQYRGDGWLCILSCFWTIPPRQNLYDMAQRKKQKLKKSIPRKGILKPDGFHAKASCGYSSPFIS